MRLTAEWHHHRGRGRWRQQLLFFYGGKLQEQPLTYVSSKLSTLNHFSPNQNQKAPILPPQTESSAPPPRRKRRWSRCSSVVLSVRRLFGVQLHQLDLRVSVAVALSMSADENVKDHEVFQRKILIFKMFFLMINQKNKRMETSSFLEFWVFFMMFLTLNSYWARWGKQTNPESLEFVFRKKSHDFRLNSGFKRVLNVFQLQKQTASEVWKITTIKDFPKSKFYTFVLGEDFKCSSVW